MLRSSSRRGLEVDFDRVLGITRTSLSDGWWQQSYVSTSADMDRAPNKHNAYTKQPLASIHRDYGSCDSGRTRSGAPLGNADSRNRAPRVCRPKADVVRIAIADKVTAERVDRQSTS